MQLGEKKLFAQFRTIPTSSQGQGYVELQDKQTHSDLLSQISAVYPKRTCDAVVHLLESWHLHLVRIDAFVRSGLLCTRTRLLAEIETATAFVKEGAASPRATRSTSGAKGSTVGPKSGDICLRSIRREWSQLLKANEALKLVQYTMTIAYAAHIKVSAK